MKSKMSAKTRPMSEKQKAMQTGYARAVLDPQNGPLVGVPQFVPVDTHRVRVKACGQVTLNGKGRIFLNPCALGSKDTACITSFAVASTGDVHDARDALAYNFATNAPYASTDYMVTTPDSAFVTAANIDNPDGVRSRVVGCIFTIRPISNSQVRDGIIVALHEKHHKTLETFTSSQMAIQENAIVKSCSSGNAISLLYRPVKPEEVDEFQFAGNRLNGHVFASADTGDGTVSDAFPGYMAFNWEGTGAQNFWVEAHGIVEYAGEVVTTLATPTHFGAAIKAAPSDVRHVSDAADSMEGAQA